MRIVFVTASHIEEVLNNNLLKSKIFEKYKLIIQRGYYNVPRAYNEIKNIYDIVIYIHHDVFLPDTFEDELLESIYNVNKIDNNWGVLGVAGVVPSGNIKLAYGSLVDRGTLWSENVNKLPHKVQTVDELILVTHGDFIFDEKIPSNHFYGADICMQAIIQRRKNYVIKAFLYHNSSLVKGTLPSDFNIAKEYFKNKYKKYFPIATTCAMLR